MQAATGRQLERSLMGITEKAKDKLTEIFAQQEREGLGLRVAVKGGCGCNPSYDMKFVAGPGPGDEVIDCGSFNTYIDPISHEQLKEAILDFHAGEQEEGFTITNPNEKTSCGSGSC
jgi:iron-sulfur cluster assembly protein